MSTQRRKSVFLYLVAIGSAFAIGSAHAQELIVKVTMVKSAQGEVGCALFSSANGFPTENVALPTKWQASSTDGVVCRFTDIKPGPYAVAVSHDLNGNRRTDTNFLGIPKEDWGVSNNVRPNLRAPTFDEARFEVAATGVTTVEIKLGR
jgi:uncharacterized protein (DUF2141 family)